MFYVWVFTAVSLGHRISLVLSTDMGPKSTSLSACGLELLGTLSCTLVWYLTDLLLSDIVIFWTPLTRAAWRCSCSCEAQFVVSACWSTSALWGRCLLFEHFISRKVDWAPRANGMACLVSGSNSHGFFHVGAPERACLCSPSQDYQRSCVKTSSTCDRIWCQHVKACLRECHVVHCHLAWDGRRPLWTPIVTVRHLWLIIW
jgi:hypothetical protein